MTTFKKTSLRASLIAATLAALPLGVNAAGLGRITVLSALGQPLRAEIELTATAAELKSMTAAVAPVSAFKDASIAYAPALGSVRMTVEQRGGRSFVRLNSSKPVNDPFLDVLVELTWSSGRLLREYTFLLDPPDMPAPAASSVVGSIPVAQPRASAARPIRGGAASGGGEYRVRRGDTLSKIARENKPAAVSVDQMLVALYQANREAFIDDNINRLRAGVILNVPDAQTVSAVSSSEARQQVIAHATDFNAYRRRVAARVADSAPAEVAAPSQSSAGKITAKVEEPAADAVASKDQVRISKTESVEGAPADTAGPDAAARRLAALEEDLVARDKALSEANERLASLEKNIAELQRLIELKNENLASLQQQAQAPAAPQVAPAPMPAPAAPPAEADAPVSAAEQDALDKELKDLVAAPDAAPAPALPAPAPPPAAEAPVPPEPKPAPPPPPPMPAPIEQPSFAESLMEDPTTLYGGGAALALLLGYGLYRSRQRAPAGKSPEETAMASIFPPDQNSVFGETGGQSVDTGSSSLIQTDFSQSGLSAIDADEGVDPVAEADVYMAYGRDAQAEEILLDAMKADPSRTAVHLKLLEIYAQRKNLQQFETTATELYTVTGGNGEAWEKAVEMGRKLDPDNPLFSRPALAEEDSKSDASGFTAPDAPSESLAAAGAALAGVAATAAAAAVSDASDEAETPEPEIAPAAEAPAETPAPDDDAMSSTSETSLDFGEPLDFSNSIPTAEEPSPSQLKDTWAIPGDLNQFTDSDLESVANGELERTAEADDSLDAGDLDFNLDLDEAPDDAADTPDAAAPADADADEIEIDLPFDAGDSSLEFNLDLSEPPPGGDATLAETRVNGLDPVANLEATDAGTSSGIDFQSVLTDPEATDTGLPAVDASADDGDGVAVVDLEKTNFDGSLLDFDFELDETSGGAEQSSDMMATSLDLSDINLDLEGGDDAAPVAEPAPEPAPADDVLADIALPDVEATNSSDDAVAPPVADEDTMMASLTKSVVTSLTDSRSMPDMPQEDELNQEVDTKLELARAYEEMGDAEGARELLEEVLRDGDEAQQEQARGVLARLA